MNLDLTGKRALVCGSSQGIGKAVAEELALLGAECVLFARNEAALRAVCDTLFSGNGQKHDVLIANFEQPQEVQQAIETYLAHNPPFHILINNTGGPKGGLLYEASTDALSAAFAQHILNYQLLVQALLPGMKSAGYGRIINIVSTSVKQPIPNLGVSNTIRGATSSWAKTLSFELAEFGITINNVLPGFTDTARLDALITANSARLNIPKEELSRTMQSEVPAKRFGTAHEIAAVAAFLATPAAAYVNGANIPVDGGRTSAF